MLFHLCQANIHSSPMIKINTTSVHKSLKSVIDSTNGILPTDQSKHRLEGNKRSQTLNEHTYK